MIKYVLKYTFKYILSNHSSPLQTETKPANAGFVDFLFILCIIFTNLVLWISPFPFIFSWGLPWIYLRNRQMTKSSGRLYLSWLSMSLALTEDLQKLLEKVTCQVKVLRNWFCLSSVTLKTLRKYHNSWTAFKLNYRNWKLLSIDKSLPVSRRQSRHKSPVLCAGLFVYILKQLTKERSRGLLLKGELRSAIL